MPILYRLLLLAPAFVLATTEEVSPPKEGIVDPTNDDNQLPEKCKNKPLSLEWSMGAFNYDCDFYEKNDGRIESYCDHQEFKDKCCFCGGGDRGSDDPKTADAGKSGPQAKVSESSSVVREAYRQIEEAADLLLANGDPLWKIQKIVQAKRSDAKTADFNRKIEQILGPKSMVKVHFVTYGYDETIYGDEKHYLVWDMLPKDDDNTNNDGRPSYRFSLVDPLDDFRFRLPGDWGEFKYFLNHIEYWKGYEVVGQWLILCQRRIEQVEMMDRIQKDQQNNDDFSETMNKMKNDKQNGDKDKRPSFFFNDTLARMEKYRDEVEAIAKEKFEQLKAETPEFSFAKAVPGLFQEMSDTLGASETDIERALEAIQSLAREQIYFSDIFES